MLHIKQQIGLITLLVFSVATELMAKQVTVGWIETVTLGQQEFSIRAKIDTGADNSSMNAEKFLLYSKEGRQWVKFSIENKDGHRSMIDKPIVKMAKIKKKDGGSQKRMVIELDICLSGIKKKAKVNLVNRSHFKYQMLIGRSFLNPEFLVDSSKTYMIRQQCQ